MNEYYIKDFPNFGYLLCSLTDEQMFPIKEEINEIKKNFTVVPKRNNVLAGNIKHEYSLTKSFNYIQNLLLPLVATYENHFNYVKNINIMNKSLPLMLDDVWVNFQQKNEFNPNHTHTGVLSFVLWVEVPYLIEDEYKISPGKQGNNDSAGQFEFQYSDSLGSIRSFKIPADSKFNNNIIIFPSKFMHCVYPFYSSNNYRISVAGNLKFKIE
jgi:hypothetical protein